MALSRKRRELYDWLEETIGHTPLGEIKNIDIGYGNRILFKEEYRNPTGSHYDREFVRLLRDLESRRQIVPHETPLIETTTGNAGASFAWTCRILGYDCRVIIPVDMPSARIAQIRSLGSTIIYSPRGEYVKGIIERLRAELHGKGKREYCPNHAADEVHSIAAMKDLAEEIIADLPSFGVRKIDYFVSALGNGSSLRGVGTVLRDKFGVKIIGMEPFECPTNFVMKFPGRFEKEYGHKPRLGPHDLIGTGAWEADFEFPNTNKMLPYVEDIVLVAQDEWDIAARELADRELQFVGRTSAACFHAARKIAQRERNKIFLVIFYDPAWKYLSLAEEN